MSDGLLMNLRICLLSTAILWLLSLRKVALADRRCVDVLCALNRVFAGDRRLDRALDVSRVGKEVVEEEGRGGADQSGDQVNGHVLGPERGAAGDGLDELG